MTPQGVSLATDEGAFPIDRYPDVCPQCHFAVEVKPRGGVRVPGYPGENRAVLEIIFRCPRQACGRLFLGYYTRSELAAGTVPFDLARTVPSVPVPPSVPQRVAGVSPQFVAINREASAAESHGLTAIAGAGYRKALEFLVKDFCVREHRSEEAAIKRKPLANVIEEYVDSTNIKQCAKRAAWLGNDETHYVRTWDARDVSDMKLLIRLTVNWIDDHITTQEYIQEMPPPEKRQRAGKKGGAAAPAEGDS
jgi:hypothetical protein